MSERFAVDSVEDALSAMDAALDYLLDVDPAVLAGRHREVLVGTLERKHRTDAAVLRMTEVLDAGGEWQADTAASTQAWMRSKLHLTPADAGRTVRTARRVRDLPLMRDALRRGAVSLRHVEVVTEAMGRTEERRDTIAQAEPTFVEAAQQLDPRRLGRVVTRWKHAVDPQGEVEREYRVRTQRFLNLDTTFDGAVAIRGLCDPETGALIKTAVDAMSNAKYRTERAERLARAVADGDEAAATPAQRRMDALAEVCRRFLDRAGAGTVMGLLPHVSVLVEQSSLAAGPDEPGHEPAELEGIGLLSAEAARRISCEARVTGFTVDAEGQPLAYGRTQRTVPPSLRRYLNVRDGGCAFPGCDRPTTWTQAHHLVHWSQGGATDADNLALLCIAHHHAMHEGGHSFRGSPERGTLTFHRPDGSLLGPANRRSDAPRLRRPGADPPTRE